MQKDVDEKIKKKLVEEEMNYKYHRIGNTLKAKYKFLMNNYDQSSVVKKLEIDDLKKLVETNTAVN